MITHGNRHWHNATNNTLKSVITINPEAFKKLQDILEKNGLNYYAYEKNNAVIMAVNKKDVDLIKKLIGFPLAERLHIQSPSKPYLPKKIIGNMEYRYISQKNLFVIKETDIALKVADLLEKQEIKFSGLVQTNKTTLTVSAADLPRLKEINALVLKMRAFNTIDTVKKIEKSKVIGNVKYSDIKNKAYIELKMTEAQYKRVAIFLNETELAYSGIIKNNGKITITTEADKQAQFMSALSVAENEVNILSDLLDKGINNEQAKIMKNAIYAAAQNGDNISRWFDSRYNNEQLRELSELMISYAHETQIERMLDKNGTLAKIHSYVNELNGQLELADIFAEHNYTDTQKELIIQGYSEGIPKSILEFVDERFSNDEIQTYFKMYHQAVHGEIDPHQLQEYLDNTSLQHSHEQNTSQLMNAFKKFAEEKLQNDITVRNAYQNSDKQNFQLEVKNAVNNLLTDLIAGNEQMIYLTFDEISTFYNEFFRDETFRDEIYDSVAEQVSNVITKLETAREKAKELGIPFSDRFVNGIDDDDELNMYVYDGSMTPEDYDKWKLLNELSAITGTDDDTPYRLIEAFEANPDEARNTIFEILNDNNLAQKVFTAIADSEYMINGNSSKINDNEKSFSEQVDDVLNRKANRYDDIKVCDTPQILLDVGCEQLPMLYTQNHLKKAVKPKNLKKHTHGLDKEQIKKLPSLLENPVMIYDSLSRKDSLVVVTSEFDNENNPIIVSIHPNGDGKYNLERVNSNFITSIHGRENFVKHLEKELEADNLLYVNKEKSQELFSVLGLQFPKGLNSLDFNNIIHQSRNIVNGKNSVISNFREKAKEQFNNINNHTAEEKDNPLRLAFEKLISNHDFPEKTLKLLDRIERQMNTNGYSALDPKLLHLPIFATNYGKVSRINSEFFDGNFKDIISELNGYIKDLSEPDKEKTDQIHSFAVVFGLDEKLLKSMIQLNLTEANINEFGRFDKLKQSVNKDNAKAFLEKVEGTTIIPPKVNMKVDKILRNFILTGDKDIISELNRYIKDLSEPVAVSEEGKSSEQDIDTPLKKTAPEEEKTELAKDDKPFQNTYDTYGEQLSLFGNNESLNTSKPAKDNSAFKIPPTEKDDNFTIENLSKENPEKTAEISQQEHFQITDENLGEGGAKAKFNANINAIQTLQRIEAEKRNATPEEQEILSKYVGWGGIPQAFDKDNVSWSAEYTRLKELLSPEEYRQANASVLDAFYTSPTVIDSIYSALDKFRFEGGNVLEPAMGVGNFFGRMPEEIQKNSQLYGMEIDSISGRIAQKLYPDADIAVKGFEKNNFQNGCFDVAVGNVPFGELNFKDEKHGTTKLHDYFFAETLDKVKDGGIVAFVTSAGTLDKRDESTRLMLADKSDFIGAIRLPGGKNGAFKDNAGTEVTTDIIFLKKNNHKSVAEMSDIPDWVHIGETADGLPINKYFEQNPDMVLGTVIEGNKLYGSGTMVVAEDGADLKAQLSRAVSKLSAEISKEPARDVYAKTNNQTVQIPSELRNLSYFEFNNNIYFKTSENECDFKYNSKDKEYDRIKAYIGLRDCTRDLLTAQEQDKPDSEIEALQAKLNTLYDSFNKKYKLLHSRTNKSMLKDDISYSLVSALEKKIENNKLIEKSDLFTKRTIKPAKVVSHVDTALEALMLSISEKAKIDFAYMEKLTDLSKTALIDELHGQIYSVPGTDEYQSSSEYLSGDIKVKLTEAENALKNGDSRMKDNIEALKGAMPEPLKAGDIDVKIGATWIDKKYYQEFIYETFDTPYYYRENGKKGIWQRNFKNITIDYSPYSGEWEISNSSADKSVKVTKEFGTKKMNAYEIIEKLLNLKDPKINQTVYVDGKKKYVIDPEATKLAQRKAEKIKSAWKDWIFKDPERRAELVQRYNDLFNSIRPREYDGSHLRFPGMNSEIQLHSHQKNAVAHSLFGGNTLFAHCVGAGKTYEMIASAMESKRLGLCTKSLFAVPNHLTEQIGSDFRKLYPNSNILVATKSDFTKNNRQALFAKIAAGNFDAVIIGHSQLAMLPMSKEREENILNEQINDIVHGLQDLKKAEGSKFQVKAMERTKKSLEKRLDSLRKEQRDDVITFEQLGIDKLYVDEAHEFKNLFTPTKLQNVSGISSSSSQKALDLFMKCQYLNEKTGGKGIVFATGTPLSNSVTELHTMMRYLEYDFLKSKNLQHFDNWITVFGEQKTDWELAPAGNKFKQRTRIANYTGLPELISMYKQVADVRTADTLNLDVPECEMHIVNVEATDFQKKLVQELSDRADDVQDGKVDPTDDNMLRITSDGRKLGLDPRLINPDFEDNENTKLNQCVNNVFKIYQDTEADKLTQIIFCDLGVPHTEKSSNKTIINNEEDVEIDNDNKSISEKESLEEECDFCVYDDIKKKLIAKGVSENEIAFIHSAKTEKAKSELFEKVRSGEIRVLLGSTGKMGTGTNVQDKLIAVHDLDIPWRPADMEQRRGRIVRQGNHNKKVHVYRYVTKGTFDAYSYQTLENKQKFISQIQTSNAPVRQCEDVDQQALNYSEIKALCTGDERIKEKMSLDNEVKELKLLKAEYTNTKYELEDKIKRFPTVEQRMNRTINNLKTDLEHCKSLPVNPETNLPRFAIEIKNVTYTDRTEAAKALESACINMIGNVGEAVKIGSFHGFPLTVEYSGLENGIAAKLHGAAIHRCDFSVSFSNNLKRLESSIFNIEQRIDNVNTELQKKIIDVNEAKRIVQQPFAQEKELETKEQRLTELTDELNQSAMAEKLANPDKKRTCYFEMARMKKMSMGISPKKSQNHTKTKNQSQDKAI